MTKIEFIRRDVAHNFFQYFSEKKSTIFFQYIIFKTCFPVFLNFL